MRWSCGMRMRRGCWDGNMGGLHLLDTRRGRWQSCRWQLWGRMCNSQESLVRRGEAVGLGAKTMLLGRRGSPSALLDCSSPLSSSGNALARNYFISEKTRSAFGSIALFLAGVALCCASWGEMPYISQMQHFSSNAPDGRCKQSH